MVVMHFTEKCALLGQENNFCTSIALDFNQLICGRPGLNIPLVRSHFVCVSMYISVTMLAASYIPCLSAPALPPIIDHMQPHL